jgi:septum formation protein
MKATYSVMAHLAVEVLTAEMGLPIIVPPHGAFFCVVTGEKWIGSKIPESLRLPDGHVVSDLPRKCNSDVITNDGILANFLVFAAGVVTTPASGMGFPEKRCVLRISLAVTPELLRESADRMKHALDQLRTESGASSGLLPVILGSSSKWRQKLVKEWGINAELMSPDIDEKAIRDPNPATMVVKIARGKTAVLLPQIKQDAILITSDQVIVCNGEVREKPETADRCREYLRSYRTHPAEAYVGIVVTNTKTGKSIERVAVAKQHFMSVSEELIEELIRQGDVMTCAGGFVVEQMTAVAGKLEGELSTIMGLSKNTTLDMITEVQKAS